jgi:hypothetical protein
MTSTGDLTAHFLSSHKNLLLKAVHGPTMLPATQPRDLLITDTLGYCQRTCAASVSALPCLARTNLFHPARSKRNLSHRAAFMVMILILSQRVGRIGSSLRMADRTQLFLPKLQSDAHMCSHSLCFLGPSLSSQDSSRT